MRRSRADDNQSQIVISLRGIGACVQSLTSVGDGCPDLLVGYHGQLYLLEVKDGKKYPSQRKLRDTQVRWHDHWLRTARVTVHVVESFEDCLEVIT